MKSQLLSAELTAAGYAEDVFQLMPSPQADPSLRLAVTHLHKPEAAGEQQVVLLHGQFANRGQWYRDGAKGLAHELVEAGYEVWMPEMRGHGLSPSNQGYRKNQLSDYANTDLPAIDRFLKGRRSNRSLVWVGQGIGAWALLQALAESRLDAERVGSLVLIGLDDPGCSWRNHRLSFWSRLAAKRKGVAPLPRALDPYAEPEPLSVLSADLCGISRSVLRLPEELTVPPLCMLDLEQEQPSKRFSGQLLERWSGRKRRLSIQCQSFDEVWQNPQTFQAIRSAMLLWLRGHNRERAPALA